MSPTIPAQQPRRRVWRRVVALGLAALVLGSVWKTVMRQQAASELRAAGFWPGREDVWHLARADYRLLFKRETWHVERKAVLNFSHPELRNLDALGPSFRRLEIELIDISACHELQNVDGLKNLPTLKRLNLVDCTALRDMDGVKGLAALQHLDLRNCTSLENVDALHGLKALKAIDLRGCDKLSAESIAVLKAALPNAAIAIPDGTPPPLF